MGGSREFREVGRWNGICESPGKEKPAAGGWQVIQLGWNTAE